MIYFVTGGAGFIGSNFLKTFVPRHSEHTFVNVDCLTYSANLMNLEDIQDCDNYRFEGVDITDYEALEGLFQKYSPDVIVHFAAESHVDRSIVSPRRFIETNIIGTFNLLELARHYWKDDYQNKLFHHVSTDEVYGSLGKEGYFEETTPYDPSSPYSSSKASSDHLVRAYGRTYGLQFTLTNCSNNYGPYQFPEKLIPLMIRNILSGKPLPVYGKGENVRDWLYVVDHCEAIWTVMEKGERGESYNIGGNNERTNMEVINALCHIVSEITGKEVEDYLGLIKFVEDRPGHDLRYAINASKMRNELGWEPKETFESGMRKTVKWYVDNQEWVESVCSGEYQKWIEKNYKNRER
ncbi:MAG: dTDP-glucose 4,6-dehydratase [Clostridia bacterium]|nr:dTDP-glucose 4,6-dehydratase [Clostridia bacterium]